VQIRQLALEPGSQSFSFNVLKDDEAVTVLLADLVYRADVRMIQSGGSLGFPQQTLLGRSSVATSAGRNLIATLRPSRVSVAK